MLVEVGERYGKTGSHVTAEAPSAS
jgi:hypothetical protein